MSDLYTLHSSSRYPTTLIVNGANSLGIEVAKSLLEQGGYVIIIDSADNHTEKAIKELKDFKQLTLLDFTAITHLEDELRRLDYVFYFQHRSSDYTERVSTQEFLQFSNYLDTILNLTTKFEAKFLLTTAIKAHQLVVSSKELDLNYFAGTEQTHHVYTEFEIQRYAESLVKEYEEKVGIDARILRLGEMIGKGIDVNFNSILVKLVVAGLTGKNLKIPGDGLETDYYVHHLDAAYGVLKAQFSLNTKGKIYTLANEEEVSVLSVAYRLLELIANAKDIEFNSNDDTLPPLRLYKPAQNLSEIGWKPRVNFERALAQTVDYIKAELSGKPSVENEMSIEDNEETTSESATEELPQDLEGALARLVAERKQQERGRKGSIILANNKLRDRLKDDDQFTSFQKLSNKLSEGFDQVKKRFQFLKYVTLTDLVFSIIGVTAFAIIYFILIAPVLSLGKDIIVISTSLSGLKNSMQEYNFQASKEFSNQLKNSLVSAQEKIEKVKFVFDLLNKEELYTNTQTLLSEAVQYTSGYEEVTIALEPFGEYITTQNPNATVGFSSSNIINISNSKDYATLLSQMNANSRLLNIGLTKIEKSENEVVSSLEKMPEWIKKRYSDNLQNLTGANGSNKFLASSYQYLPTLLGNNGKTTYLIVVQDNSRYNAAGGDIAGLLLLEYTKGSITNADVYTVDTLESSVGRADINEEIIAEINLVSNKDVNTSNLTFNDFGYITDKKLFLEAVENVFAANVNTKPDMTIALNLNVLQELLKHRGQIDFQAINFSDSNMLSNIDLLVGENADEGEKNNIIMNLFANIFVREFNAVSNTFPILVNIFGQEIAKGNINFYSSNLDINNYLQQVEQNDKGIIDKIIFGVNHDSENQGATTFPILTLVVDVKINADFTTQKAVEVKTSGTNSYENVYVCAPSGAIDFNYAGTPRNLVGTTFSLDKVCSVFLENESNAFNMSYNTLKLKEDGSGVDEYTFLLEKNSGVFANIEVRFNFAEGITAVPYDSSFINQNGMIVYNKASYEGVAKFKFILN